MHLSAGLTADLNTLTATVDDPNIDLARSTREFVSDIDDAAASITTMSVTVEISGVGIRLAATGVDDDDEPATTSLRVMIMHAPQSEVSAHVLLRSGTSGSLTALAAAATSTFGLDAVHTDDHLDIESSVRDGHDLASVTQLNRAVGVLIDGGRTAAEGRAELIRLAALSGASVGDVASRVLRDAVRWHPPAR
jgi:hypothetical protein